MSNDHRNQEWYIRCMWYSDRTYSPEEIEILRELEYDLFMFNPGFRSVWGNDFKTFFKALVNKELWDERNSKVHGSWEDRMEQDSEFRAFMQRQSLIDEVLLGDLDIKYVPLDVQAEIKETQRESEEAAKQVELYERLGLNPCEDHEEHDVLYTKANNWQEGLNDILYDFYKQTKHKDAFRILQNHSQVPVKIYSVADMREYEPDLDFQWRPDRIAYTLALTSVNRCLESLENLKDTAIGPNLDSHVATAKEIRQELMDRLDAIEQLRPNSLK